MWFVEPGTGRPSFKTYAVKPPSPPNMDERSWELYRLSVVQEMPDCCRKQAILTAIQHKLDLLSKLEGDPPAISVSK